MGLEDRDEDKDEGTGSTRKRIDITGKDDYTNRCSRVYSEDATHKPWKYKRLPWLHRLLQRQINPYRLRLGWPQGSN